MLRKLAPLLLLVSLLASGCAAAPSRPPVTATLTPGPLGALTPYHTQTPAPLTPTPTFAVTIQVTPSPTSTPFLHTLTKDDTMMGLAFRYGVSLEALKTANPSVIPNAMTVGSQLVIPITAEPTSQQPTPTSIPVRASEPLCTPTGDGGAWCVVALANDTPSILENLSVWIGLYDPGGSDIASQVAYAPLDILEPGSTMPFMAFFAPPLPAQYTARSEVVTASAISAGDSRYVHATTNLDQINISPDGSQAELTGQVLLPGGNPSVTQVWVLAVAYDAGGNILGVRKWKSDTQTDFTLTVYSLGGPIDHVELLDEVRP